MDGVGLRRPAGQTVGAVPWPVARRCLARAGPSPGRRPAPSPRPRRPGGPAPALGMLVLQSARPPGAAPRSRWALQPVAVQGPQQRRCRAPGVGILACSGIQAGAQKRGLFGAAGGHPPGRAAWIRPDPGAGRGVHDRHRRDGCHFHAAQRGWHGCASGRCWTGAVSISSRMRCGRATGATITSAHRNVQHARHVGIGQVTPASPAAALARCSSGAGAAGSDPDPAVHVGRCIIRARPVSPGPGRPAPAHRRSSRGAGSVQRLCIRQWNSQARRSLPSAPRAADICGRGALSVSQQPDRQPPTGIAGERALQRRSQAVAPRPGRFRGRLRCGGAPEAVPMPSPVLSPGFMSLCSVVQRLAL